MASKLRGGSATAPAVTLLMLVGMGVDWWSLPKPAEAEAYHRNVRAVAEGVPLRVGDWIGQSAPVPAEAVKMLRPNVILSRRYVNGVSGTWANLLLVQCGDARDIVAHYPPICLRNAGWTLNNSSSRDWLVQGLGINGTEYQFSLRSLSRMSSIVVDNFMVLPNGRIGRDMEAVNQAAGMVTRRYLGAAQVQIVTDAALTQEERDSAFKELVGALHPTLKAILSGGAP